VICGTREADVRSDQNTTAADKMITEMPIPRNNNNNKTNDGFMCVDRCVRMFAVGFAADARWMDTMDGRGCKLKNIKRNEKRKKKR
jgi:hypothetical protein